MGTAFVDGVTSLLSGITSWFTTVFAAISNILYTAPSGTGETAVAGGLTAIGWVVCILVGISVFGFAFKALMALVHKIKAGR